MSSDGLRSDSGSSTFSSPDPSDSSNLVTTDSSLGSSDSPSINVSGSFCFSSFKLTLVNKSFSRSVTSSVENVVKVSSFEGSTGLVMASGTPGKPCLSPSVGFTGSGNSMNPSS